MTASGNKTASYKIVKHENGNAYRFFCDVSGAMVYETSVYSNPDPESELMSAWEEGKEYFNLCHKCGMWVMDAMYNPDVLNCVQCSPIEDIPDYCPKCGEKTRGEEIFCRKCGVRLMYGGESDDYD